MLKPSYAKRLSDLLPTALGPAAAKQGFAGAEILARWETIVGSDLAAFARPVKLAAPPRSPSADPKALAPATLTLRVEGAFALEVQHRAPEIMERVNAHLGWACVGAIKLRQGHVSDLSGARRRRPPPPATEDEADRVRAATVAVEDEGLNAALQRLGHAALAKARSKPSDQ
jgi:hypothetical protein